jgi:hypothetical protein
MGISSGGQKGRLPRIDDNLAAGIPFSQVVSWEAHLKESQFEIDPALPLVSRLSFAHQRRLLRSANDWTLRIHLPPDE